MWGGRLQGITQSNSCLWSLVSAGFLSLVNDWVKFLVGLLVFKQVVDEAIQFACGVRCGLGRSKVACLRR